MKINDRHSSLRHIGRVLADAGLLRSSLAPDLEVDLTGISEDSRTIRSGALFIAVRGPEQDGHRYIPDALRAGAAAVVCEKDPQIDTDRPILLVKDSRRARSLIAIDWFDNPSHTLNMVGVTGTNGKTTTTWLVHGLLSLLGVTAGLIGTIEHRTGTHVTSAKLTTPGPIETNRLLREMLSNGCTHAVMEVSSHALVQDRVFGQQFGAGVFTNLTRDHLDYHGNWDAYVQAKKRLFDELDERAFAVYNVDDPSSHEVTAHTAAERIGLESDPRPTIDSRFWQAQSMVLPFGLDGTNCAFQLCGRFNAYNLTAAYSVGRSLGYGQKEVVDALQNTPGAPGRFEKLTPSNGVHAIVDYAHTPDALQNILQAVRDISDPKKLIWCVFGCGGDRDKGKRPQMGRVAETLADRVIVTSDNPRTESPEEILKDVRAGMEQPDQALWITDRREAIALAGRLAQPDDTVVIAGKGHESHQVVGTEKISLDDRTEIMRWSSSAHEPEGRSWHALFPDRLP